MPFLAVSVSDSDSYSDSPPPSKRSSSKKYKKQDLESATPDIAIATPVVHADNSSLKKSKKKKKRRLSSDEYVVSDPPSLRQTVKKQKVEAEESGEEEEEEVVEANPKVLRETLKSKGIEALFPIQAITYDVIVDGADLFVRAPTGQGKTLAFVLPILESLISGRHKASMQTGYGRTPCVLVLLPTRELANQVHADFEVYGGAIGLTACCLYGGSSYFSQEMELKRGVDIVVGTPSWIKDHIKRKTLNLKALKFRVLDEADEMLNLGFIEDVELILGEVEDVTKVQTLLFSATLPVWVKKISQRFLKPDKKTADLVGNEKMKASASVRHLVLPCFRPARAHLIPDILRRYSRGGRTIIFVKSRESASELAGLLPGARALHGDIVQAQREVILAGFRSGKFLVLVATNVAARGLDINDVQLIIQCEPPRDVAAYIHWSGRTGRDGNTGVVILLYEPRYSNSILRVERESGVKFEHIFAPQAADVAESTDFKAAGAISDVSDSVISVFESQAKQLLESSCLPTVDLLAKALAKAAAYADINRAPPPPSMPSLAVSDSPSPSKRSSSKKSKKQDLESPTLDIAIATPVVHASDLKRSKKNKKRTDNGEIDAVDADNSSLKKSKKKKKRRLSSDEDVVSDPPSPRQTVKKQKVEAEESGEEEEVVEANPNLVSNLRISEVLRETLKSKGIKALFPIQATTYDIIVNGADLFGRARTGQGKTLAFVLPILESLINGRYKASMQTGYGRTPSVLVLLPTRKLAYQVHADFEVYGGATGLTACCLCGGSPYRSQEMVLKRGVDIVVGTPGRIKDHIERKTLNLRALKFRVLDVADEMLNMGFVEDVELILGEVEDVTKVQTLLFSATLPGWVKEISQRFLKSDKKTPDLVVNEKMKASASVRHLVLPCSRPARAQLIPDILCCYSRGGRTVIFVKSRESASELAGLLPGARALHGDTVQAQREVILAGFRSGNFLVLVATNVAARGLDINDVQLVIQCGPPRDVAAYIDWSGRTGRAGNTGVVILLYEPRYYNSILRVVRESGVKFEHISAPQAADVVESAGFDAAEAISDVSDSVVSVFRSQAEQLLKSSGLPAVRLLAKALAKAAGYTYIKKRSLLSSMENYETLLLQTRSIYTPSLAFSTLKRFLPDEKIQGIKGLALTADGMGAVFDVPSDDVQTFLEDQENVEMVTIEVLQKLPPLQEKDQGRGNGSKRGRFARVGGGGRFFGNRSWGGGLPGKSFVVSV